MLDKRVLELHWNIGQKESQSKPFRFMFLIIAGVRHDTGQGLFGIAEAVWWLYVECLLRYGMCFLWQAV